MKTSERVVVIAAICVGILVICVAWSPVSLGLAKRKLANTYADMEERDTLNIALAPRIRELHAGLSGQSLISSEYGGYRFSMPASQYWDASDRRPAFESDHLTVVCLGVGPLGDIFAEVSVEDEATRRYFAETDPFQIMVDAYNACPNQVADQESFEDLRKLAALLVLKTMLTPVGTEALWERLESQGRQAIIAGDITTDAILVTIYLPETRETAEILINVEPAATMADVYRAIADLEITQTD
jgi:hypothetical protein